MFRGAVFSGHGVDSLLRGRTVGYPSVSLASCSVCYSFIWATSRLLFS